MKEIIKRKKKMLIFIIAIILILLIGLAFAYLVTTLHGDKDYIVRVGTLDLVLNEGNELTLEKQIPLEDFEGQSLNGFSFSLVNNGSVDTDYTIYLDDIELSEDETRMPDSAIRYSLTRDDETFSPRNLTTMGSNPNRRVDFGTINPDETINYTLRIWIDYDATTEEASGKTFKGKLRVEASQGVGEEASTVLLENIPEDNLYDDGTDTFITGEDPNNYIWYSGKLWRAVSVNNEAKTTKLVTQWNISAISYDDDSSAFAGSYMEDWLNDTSVDGFLGNLRDYERFIKIDSKWNDNITNGTYKPQGEMITMPVGLLNLYEYTMSCSTTSQNCYLNNGLSWWTISNNGNNQKWYISNSGNNYVSGVTGSIGIRPSINLKSTIKVVDGDGTESNPYRLEGDNDSNLSGTMLNTRYSGEYIRFGNSENNLYRIVSHENRGLTKITSSEPLKNSGTFVSSVFGSSSIFSSTNTIGTFLNGEYLNNYIDNSYSDMIEDSTTWYLGTVESETSYKLSKYTDINMSSTASNTTTAKVGLLRYGELMSGQFDIFTNNNIYWLLTPYNESHVWYLYNNSMITNGYNTMNNYGIRPSLNLKSNVIITGGDGTKNNPFTLS